MRRLLCLLALTACYSSTYDDRSPADFYGVWGAPGARVSLSLSRTYFESACWYGEFTVPILVDGEAFTALGSLNAVGGASGEPARGAEMRGLLSGDILSVTMGPPTLGLGPYTMRRDEAVTIPGCP